MNKAKLQLFSKKAARKCRSSFPFPMEKGKLDRHFLYILFSTVIECPIPKARQHFGNTLNYHPHFHLVVADGIFSGEDGLAFHEATLTQDDIIDTQEAIQKRVLRYFCKLKYDAS